MTSPPPHSLHDIMAKTPISWVDEVDGGVVVVLSGVEHEVDHQRACILNHEHLRTQTRTRTDAHINSREGKRKDMENKERGEVSVTVRRGECEESECDCEER